MIITDEFNKVVQEVNFSAFVPKTSETSVKLTALLINRLRLWNSPDYSTVAWKRVMVFIYEITLSTYAIMALVETVFLGFRLLFCSQKDREWVFEKINSSIFCIGWAVVGLIENLSKQILFEACTEEYQVRELFFNRYGLSWVLRSKDKECIACYQAIKRISCLDKIYADFSNQNQSTSEIQEFDPKDHEHFEGIITKQNDFFNIELHTNDTNHNLEDSVNNLVSTLKAGGFFTWWPAYKKQLVLQLTDSVKKS